MEYPTSELGEELLLVWVGEVGGPEAAVLQHGGRRWLRESEVRRFLERRPGLLVTESCL